MEDINSFDVVIAFIKASKENNSILNGPKDFDWAKVSSGYILGQFVRQY